MNTCLTSSKMAASSSLMQLDAHCSSLDPSATFGPTLPIMHVQDAFFDAPLLSPQYNQCLVTLVWAAILQSVVLPSVQYKIVGACACPAPSLFPFPSAIYYMLLVTSLRQGESRGCKILRNSVGKEPHHISSCNIELFITAIAILSSNFARIIFFYPCLLYSPQTYLS